MGNSHAAMTMPMTSRWLHHRCRYNKVPARLMTMHGRALRYVAT